MSKFTVYAQLMGGTFLVSPLIYAFWRFDFPTMESLSITAGMYAVMWPVAIMMFNYLESGSPFKFESEYRKKMRKLDEERNRLIDSL